MILSRILTCFVHCRCPIESLASFQQEGAFSMVHPSQGVLCYCGKHVTMEASTSIIDNCNEYIDSNSFIS